jgi:hypothetical protein
LIDVDLDLQNLVAPVVVIVPDSASPLKYETHLLSKREEAIGVRA